MNDASMPDCHVITNIYPYNTIWPKLDQSVFVAPNAFISGDVEMGKGSSVWPFCSLRGDDKEIRIGEIQKSYHYMCADRGDSYAVNVEIFACDTG